MSIFLPFMRADEGYGESAHLNLCHSSKISYAGSNGDLLIFYASSEGSDQSEYLHRLTLAFVTEPKSYHVLLKINGDLSTIHARREDW